MSLTKTPDIPEKDWSNPFPEGTPLWELFDEILRQDRDLIILIDDYLARRGTGKTVASIQLANGMDQTPEGLTRAKTSLEPQEIRNAYASQPPRSGLVFDEGEVGASNRQTQTKTNQVLREIMSMGRVEQKYVVINTPSRGFIDKDILRLADVWISMTRRGQGLVHFLEHETYSNELLTPQVQWLEIDDIPRGTQLREVYNHLDARKREKIDGEDGNTFLTVEEHEEILERERKQTRKDVRDEIIVDIMTNPEVQKTAFSQRMLGESIGLKQPTISDILPEGWDQINS